VTPEAAFAGNIVTYSLNLTVSQDTALNTAVTDILPDHLTYLGPGTGSSPGLPSPSLLVSGVTQLVWNLPLLAPGNYRLSYQARVEEFVESGTVLVNKAVLVSPQLAAPVSASAAATVIGNYTVKIGVYNEAGELVKEILIEDFSQPIENIRLESSNVINNLHGEGSKVEIYYGTHLIGTWDGTNRDGNLVSNGDYYIKVDNIDMYGVVRSTTQRVVVDRSIYKATVLVYNEAGEVMRHLYAYMDDPGLAGVLSMQLSTSVIKPSYEAAGGTPNEVTVMMSNGVTVVWDGKSDAGIFVQSGQYFIEVNTVDGLGAQSTVVREISVQDANSREGIERVVAQPNVLNQANGYRVTFVSNTSMRLTLKASIYTLAGELVGVFQGGAGTNQVKWDASGVVSGLYLAVVEEVDAQGGRVSRQIQKIAVIR